MKVLCVECQQPLRYAPKARTKPPCARCVRAVGHARGRAHAALDALWKSGFISRSQAYKWMQKRMNLSEDDAHIALFGVAQSERVVELVRMSLGNLAATLLADDLLRVPEPKKP